MATSSELEQRIQTLLEAALKLDPAERAAFIERATADKIPVVSMGYGRADASYGAVFPYTFTYPVTYWEGADAMVTYIGGQEGGMWISSPEGLRRFWKGGWVDKGIRFPQRVPSIQTVLEDSRRNENLAYSDAGVIHLRRRLNQAFEQQTTVQRRVRGKALYAAWEAEP